jgi:hypothetical protein
MKTMKILALSTLLVAALGTSSKAVAQDAPAFNYIAQTTSKFVMPRRRDQGRCTSRLSRVLRQGDR